MFGESSVNRSSRLTKLRVTPSASASAPADRYLPSSNICFHRCARVARISVLSRRTFVGSLATIRFARRSLPKAGAYAALNRSSLSGPTS